jgi:hypothetical protein
VAIGPSGWGTIVSREQRIFFGMLTDHLGQIAAGNAAVATRYDLGLVRFLVFRVALTYSSRNDDHSARWAWEAMPRASP